MMENQVKVLKELTALVDMSAEEPKGKASFKQLREITGLTDKELDDSLMQLEKDGYIIEYPLSGHDDFGFRIVK